MRAHVFRFAPERDIAQCGPHVRLVPRTLTWLLWERMLEEETQHFPRCVRSSRISVGARRTASVSGSVDVPVLKDSAPTRVSINRDCPRLIAVVWMHRNVAIAEKKRWSGQVARRLELPCHRTRHLVAFGGSPRYFVGMQRAWPTPSR